MYNDSIDTRACNKNYLPEHNTPCKQKRRVLKLSSGGGVQFDTI